MRPALLLTLLLSSACATGAALAQQGSNWIDPPARSGAAGSGGERAGSAAKATTKAAQSEAEPPSGPGRATAPSSGRREARRHDRAAEPRRSRRSAARDRDASSATAARIARVAPSPAPPPAASMARTEPDPRFSDWAVAARRLSLDYLDSVSSPNGTTLAAAPRFYGDRVRFFGRTLPIGAVMAEKRRFFQRWPQRRYEPHGEPQVACDGPSATCLVRVVHDFTATSPARGARSQGVAELTLTVSVAGARPVIVSESSRVLSRG